MAQQLSGNDLQGWDGWIWVGAGSRVSGTSLTITGDYTGIISPGDKLKLTDTTTKYFYVLSPVIFSAGVTTLTITGGSDYSLVGTPSAISYSKMATPVGFPQWFNYTPTFTGFSANPTYVARFSINGRTVNLALHASAVGTSNATTFTITIPVTAANITNASWETFFVGADNGAAATGTANIGPNSTTVGMFKGSADSGATWTAASTKYANFIHSYEF